MMRRFLLLGRCIADRLLDRPGRSEFLPRRAETLRVERLESRELLSGNVEAFQIGSHFFLIGDSQANSLHLRELSGELVLEGTAGTTVNGSTERWVAAAAGRSLEGSLTVRLLGGNDSLLVQAGTRLGGSLTVFAGSGNDSVSVGSTTLLGSLLVAGAAGDDQIALRDLVIGGELLIETSAGDDLVSLDDVQIGRSSRLWAGSGSDALVLDRVSAGGWAELFGGSGDDTLRVTEGRATRGWIAAGGGGADLVSVVATQTDGIALFVLGSGADGLQVDAASRAAGRVIAIGGSGSDQLQVPGETSVARRAILAGGDAGAVSASLIQQRLDDPTTGALARAARAQEILGGDADPPETLTLTLDTSDNETTRSQGVDVTADPSFQIEGTTAAGASVEIDADNDGQFDDAALTADSSGRFATTLMLRHDRTNRGDNLIRVRARDAQSRQATEAVRVHYAVGTVVRMQTDLGFVDLELLDDDAPNTVANFLGYLGRYAGTVIHRVQKATRDGIGVSQGGGFVVTVGAPQAIVTDSPLDNEFDPANLNVRGSIAMARPAGNINGATSQWFINTVDNTSLDAQQFTVFGHVIGTALSIVDAILNLNDFELSGLIGLQNVPLRNYALFSETMAGTVSTAAGSTTIVGVGTSFTSAIPADRLVRISNTVFTVAQVVSDTELVAVNAAPATVLETTARVNVVPVRTQYVTLESVSVLVDPQA